MTEADQQSGEDSSPAPTRRRRPRWSTTFVVTAAVLAAALLGAAGGLFLVGSAGEQQPSPSAVDIGFAQDMAAHHRQGAEMARVAFQRTENPEIRQIAFDIASTQTEQMGRMRGWLALWSQPVRPTGDRMSWMSGSGGDSTGRITSNAASMPGMASSAELGRLRSSSGPRLETYFLQLMVRHHQGGAPMMRAAIERAEIGAVRNLAQQMMTAQTTEVATMKRMLAERGVTPLPGPS